MIFKQDYWKRFRRSLFVSICLALTFTLFGTARIYSSNHDEFSVSIYFVLMFLLPIGLVFAVLLSFFITALPENIRRMMICLVCAIAIMIYIQGTFFMWKYRPFDGTEPDWIRNITFGILGFSAWLILILSALLFSLDFEDLFVEVLSLVMVIQLAGLAIETYESPRMWIDSFKSDVQPENFSFSQKNNVIVILLDAFQATALSELIKEEPHISEDLKGFTFFKEHTGVFKSTFASVPAILTGEIYDESQPTDDFLKKVLPEKSISEALARNGYKSNLITLGFYCSNLPLSSCRSQSTTSRDSQTQKFRELARITDFVLFRHVPHFFKVFIFNRGRWFLQPYLYSYSMSGMDPWHVQSIEIVDAYKDLAKADSKQPTFHFIHLLIPHIPVDLDENCQVTKNRFEDKKTAYKRQAKCSLHLVNELLDKFKSIDAYNPSLIAVISDHGFGLPFDHDPETGPFPEYEKVFPLLLIKPPFSNSPLKTSNNLTWITDIPKTIMEMLRLPSKFPGYSAFNNKVLTKRTRYFYYFEDVNHGSWLKTYLPPLDEYKIENSAHDLKHWTKTRRIEPPH